MAQKSAYIIINVHPKLVSILSSCFSVGVEMEIVGNEVLCGVMRGWLIEIDKREEKG